MAEETVTNQVYDWDYPATHIGSVQKSDAVYATARAAAAGSYSSNYCDVGQIVRVSVPTYTINRPVNYGFGYLSTIRPEDIVSAKIVFYWQQDAFFEADVDFEWDDCSLVLLDGGSIGEMSGDDGGASYGTIGALSTPLANSVDISLSNELTALTFTFNEAGINILKDAVTGTPVDELWFAIRTSDDINGVAPEAPVSMDYRGNRLQLIRKAGDYRAYLEVVHNPTRITTSPATNIGITTAKLHGIVDSNGGAELCLTRFRYKKSGTADWTYTVWLPAEESIDFSAVITGLELNATYLFYAQVMNDKGSYEADDYESFTTEESIVYPTETRLRVSGLVHRYNRLEGFYQLEILLGGVTTNWSAVDVLRATSKLKLHESPEYPKPEPIEIKPVEINIAAQPTTKPELTTYIPQLHETFTPIVQIPVEPETSSWWTSSPISTIYNWLKSFWS